MNCADLQLVLEDCFGRGIGAPVHVSVMGPTSSELRVNVGRELTLAGLRPGEYQIEIAPEDYVPVHGALDVDEPVKQAHFKFTIRTPNIARIKTQSYAALDPALRHVLDRSHIVTHDGHVVSGQDLYKRLRSVSKAKLLNVHAKAANTVLVTGERAFDLFERLERIDRTGLWFQARNRIVDAVSASAFTAIDVTPRMGIIPEMHLYATDEGDTSLSLKLPMRQGDPLVLVGATVGVPTATASAANPYEVGQRLARLEIPLAYELFTRRRLDRAGETPTAGAAPVVYPIGGEPHTAKSRETASMPKSSSKPLTITHWIEGDDQQPQSLEAVHLSPGQTCWYCFEMAAAPRTVGTSEPFVPTNELEQVETAVMIVEVRSPLLTAGPVERRRVTYRRGVGIAVQSFELSAKPGEHGFVSQLIWGTQTIYSRGWQIRVDGDAPSVPSDPRPETSADVGKPDSARASAGEDRREYRLVIDPGVNLVQLETQTGRAIRQQLGSTQDGMVVLAAKARTLLTRHAQRYSGDAAGNAARDSGVRLLCEMAKWGTGAFDSIFLPPGQRPVGELLRTIPDGALVQVDGDPATFPWEWLYNGTPEDINHAATAPEQFLKGFLGYRLALSVLPRRSHDVTNLSLRLLNASATHILAAINPTADQTGGPATQSYLEDLPNTRKSVAADVCLGKGEAVKHLKQMRDVTPHLLYFYGHHQSGAQLNTFGYFGFGDATLFLKGKTEDPLTNDELKFDVCLAPFDGARAPLVFLNACGTAQGSEFYPSGFIPYFTTDLGAPAVIGTHAEIPGAAAHEFARAFMARWFQGEILAQALWRVRREWLEQMNPYAMYYTAHGTGLLRLEQPVQ